MSVARGCAELLAFLSSLAMARFVSPAEYGRAAVALIVGGIAVGLSAEGFGNPLVQRKEISNAHIASAMFWSVSSTAILAIATFLVAPLVVSPIFGPQASELTQVAAPLFIASGVSVVPLAIMQRALAFRRLALLEMSALTVGSCAGVGLALLGLEGKALVLGLLTTRGVAAFLFLHETGWPSMRPHRHESFEILAFGVPAATASMLSVALRNVDYALLAARMPAPLVGYYYRGFAWAVGYPGRLTDVLLRVAFPVYSRAEADGALTALRGRIVRAGVTVVFPLLALLAVTAPTIIPTLLGARWQPAVVPTQILSCAGMAATVLYTATPLWLAAGKPRMLTLFNASLLAAFAGSLLVATPYGLAAVCWTVAAVYALGAVVSYALSDRYVGVPWTSLFHDVTPGVVAAAGAWAMAAAVVAVFSRAHLPDLGVATAAWLLGGAVSGLILRFGFAEAWTDITAITRGVVPSLRERFPRWGQPARETP